MKEKSKQRLCGVERIVSGGQTGADRAALHFAIAHGIPHGGWCPRGRTAEDGALDARFKLAETPSPTYAQRTEWNVRDSDATVIFTVAPRLVGGSKLTAEFARQHHKPCLHLSQAIGDKKSAEQLREFIHQYHVRILNVAGPRESTEPAVGRFTRAVLKKLLELCHEES